MSFRYSAPGYYRCDTPNCQTPKVLGDLDIPPDGWTSYTVEVEPGKEWTKHRCPACVTKTLAPSVSG